jgi:plastocyanin
MRLTHPGSRLAAACLFASCLAPSEASAGVIRGTLWLTHPTPAARAAAEARSRSQPAQPGVSDAVIYIEDIPEKAEKKLSHHGWFSSKPKMPRVIQMDRRFMPRVISVTPGTAVEFRNRDLVYHNAFSVSVAKRFDLGRYPPGKADTVMFDRAGVVNVHCDIHPDMSGYVVVVPNHAFDRPDSLGSYALPSLPPGKYALHVWHPRMGELRRDVEIPKHGNVDLPLVF